MELIEHIPFRTDNVTLTPPAADAIRDLLSKRELPSDDYALRIFISGGGCSGFQYGMALEGQIRETDLTFEDHGVKVVVDDVSIDYLRNVTIDFVEDVMGSGFKIENPNAVASCGCGSSFRTTDSGPAPAGGCGY